jgi:hypothetical protein
MVWIKLLMILIGVTMVIAALSALAIVWPFMWIIYGLVVGGALIKFATEL